MCSIREVSSSETSRARLSSFASLALRGSVAHLIDKSNNDENVKKRITRPLVSYSHKNASKY